jgi:hypothetical protein
MIVPKAYDLLDRCVEEGVRYGLARAHKHTDTPTPEHLENEIAMAVMKEISTWFDFKGIENDINT